MNQTEPALPIPERSKCRETAGHFLAELGRIYLDAGLPLAAAVEAALADSLFFEFCRPSR